MAKAATKVLLDQITYPSDIKHFTVPQLKKLSDELRQETIEVVSITGGHLGASLGVVEMTVALHYVFNTPHDRLIWDVSHQAYPQKFLQDAANVFAHCGRAAAFLASLDVLRANTIHSVRRIVRLPSLLVWVWPLPVILRVKIATL